MPLTHAEVAATAVRIHRGRGAAYENDVVLEGGRVRNVTRSRRSHTAMSSGIPNCRLTRASPGRRPADHRHGRLGSLPIIPEVIEEARRQGVELTALPTEDACRLIASLGRDEVHAILHVTC